MRYERTVDGSIRWLPSMRISCTTPEPPGKGAAVDGLPVPVEPAGGGSFEGVGGGGTARGWRMVGGLAGGEVGLF
ncbi:MAG TPA: hypothetical protein VEJ16_01815 [Alphaproteobacteria bacterium]|nr:hypothetical protein [Alphaproteobacteria bacterium]